MFIIKLYYIIKFIVQKNIQNYVAQHITTGVVLNPHDVVMLKMHGEYKLFFWVLP